MANNYFSHSRHSADTARSIIKSFADETTATATAAKTGLLRETVDTHYRKIRRAIFLHEQRRLSEHLKKLPLDKNLLLSRFLSNKYDKESGKDFPIITVIFNDGKLLSDILSVASSDLRKLNDDLEDARRSGHIFTFDFTDRKFTLVFPVDPVRINAEHPNGKQLMTFWHFAKLRFNKFRGLSSDKFIPHLKETQWRFNNGPFKKAKYEPDPKDIYRKLLKMLRNNHG